MGSSKHSKSKKRKRKLNYPRIIFCLVFIIAIIWRIGYGLSDDSDKSTIGDTNTTVEETPVVKDKTIHIAAIGDIMCHGPNYKAAYDSTTKTYDFSPFFTQISKYTSSADITIGNLETTFAGADRGYSGYPTFNSPSELGAAIKDIGVDVVSTANNHCMDKGYSGLAKTLDTLDELGLDHIGTSRSEEEQNTVLVKDVNGIKIAFLSFTYGTNGITVPSDKKYSVNLIDKDLITEQISLAKQLSPDLICVSMHWGVEYQTTPNAEQKELADFLFTNGVDIILGSHAHVLQPMEKRTVTLEDGTTKDGFVIYSLGNFISNQSDTGTRDTVILDIQVTKAGADGKITIDSVNYTPVYCHNKGAGVANRYELIDLKQAISDYDSGNSSITTTNYNTFKNALERIEKIIKAC